MNMSTSLGVTSTAPENNLTGTLWKIELNYLSVLSIKFSTTNKFILLFNHNT